MPSCFVLELLNQQNGKNRIDIIKNGLAFFFVVAINSNLSTFINAKVILLSTIAKIIVFYFCYH